MFSGEKSPVQKLFQWEISFPSNPINLEYCKHSIPGGCVDVLPRFAPYNNTLMFTAANELAQLDKCLGFVWRVFQLTPEFLISSKKSDSPVFLSGDISNIHQKHRFF